MIIITGWWLVSTPLKNDGFRQLRDDFFETQYFWENKNVPNHQPVIHLKNLGLSIGIHQDSHKASSILYIPMYRETPINHRKCVWGFSSFKYGDSAPLLHRGRIMGKSGQNWCQWYTHLLLMVQVSQCVYYKWTYMKIYSHSSTHINIIYIYI